MGRDVRGGIWIGGTRVPAKPKSASGLRRAYLGHVFEQARKVPLAGVDRKGMDEQSRSEVDLAAVYTALLTRQSEIEGELDPRSPDLPDAARQARLRQGRALSALEVLNNEKYLALLGDPGSGKSTFVYYLSMCLAGEALGIEQVNLKSLTKPPPGSKGRDEKEPRPQPWDHGALLPVPVVLRDLAARGLPDSLSDVTGLTLWEFIAAELPENLKRIAEPLHEELQEKGGLALLDGLDEVPEAEECRLLVCRAVESFAAAFPQLRILVTSRVYAYQRQAWKLEGFAEATLAPFNQAQIGRFVECWYAHIGPPQGLSQEDAQGRAELLKAAIRRNLRLQELAERPLLLTLMASLHAWRGGELPEQRQELYHEAVDLLLDRWEGQKLRRRPGKPPELIQPSLAEWLDSDRKSVRRLLNRLAFEAHRDQPELERTADIEQSHLVGELMKLSSNPDARPRRLEEYLSQRAGILEQRGVKIYAFPHRTFQEYLAACHLTDHGFPEEPARLLRSDPNRWREVLLLAGAKASSGTASAAWDLAEELCSRDCPADPSESSPEEDHWAALLAAQVLAENGCLADPPARHRPKAERIRNWLARTVESGSLPPMDRSQAGDALALAGDPRVEVVSVDQMRFCLVPAGPFWMGEGKEQHRNSCLGYDYWMGLYPVTVAQFEAFVEDGGYRKSRVWKEAGEARYWSKEGLQLPWEKRTRCEPLGFDWQRQHGNRPIINITWYEALAFSRWAQARWRKARILPAALQVRLPSEAEWEKAARGGEKIPRAALASSLGEFENSVKMRSNPLPRRTFPWEGRFEPSRCNGKEAGIGSASCVGAFPHGVSPCGCREMSGNVWEWTRSRYEGYPYNPGDGRESPGKEDIVALRGGAYWSEDPSLGCSSRSWFNPDLRYVVIGFRLALSP